MFLQPTSYLIGIPVFRELLDDDLFNLRILFDLGVLEPTVLLAYLCLLVCFVRIILTVHLIHLQLIRNGVGAAFHCSSDATHGISFVQQYLYFKTFRFG